MVPNNSWGLDTWGNVLVSSFQSMWGGVIAFVPKLLVALIIFVLGWLAGSILGRWVAQIIQSLRLDQALRSLGVEDTLAKAGFKLNSGGFIGALVKWFMIIVFLVAALEVLGLNQVTEFLKTIVLGYLPNVIVAAFVLLIGAVVASVLEKIVVGSAKAADMPSAHLLGTLSRWAVWVFAIIAAMLQLGIAAVLLQTLFTGVVAMLALAGGLAFGLGGREFASRYLDKIGASMNSRH